MEREQQVDKTMEVKGVRTRGRGGADALAVTFSDPFRISQSAWREILRFQMFSESPACFAMIDSLGRETKLDKYTLLTARNFDRRQRRDFLDSWSFILFESQIVALAREI